MDDQLCWSLEVALREDACNIYRGQVADSLAKVRHVALNYLKEVKRFKGGIRRNGRSRAGCDLPERYSCGMRVFIRYP